MMFGSISRERWRALEPLLDAALELEPAERSAFLDRACGGDAGLRADVDALLAACGQADGILSEPAAVVYEPLLAEDPVDPPQMVGGRYHIVREIGRGGMATVYVADDPKHSRQVAVKVLHAKVARLIGRQRFMREIEIAAGLSHPHILPLHDSGEVPSERPGEPGSLFFVSPFITGESLRERLQRDPPLAIDEVRRLGREIALALDYAHRQGVVHLDVKPENILFQDGHAIVADFGIAHAMSTATEPSVRETTFFLGTPSYMSPEQALGMPDVDGRSDVYSLGCVLYEMVAGIRPFARTSSAEAIERAKAPELPDRAALTDRAPRAVVDVIMRAMAPERADRFQSASELARALDDTARYTRPVSWTGVAGRPGLIAGAALAFLGAALAVWSRAGSTLDPDLIAVAPFDAAASSLALWKEGLVDVMARNLDGAGALRAVPASVAVRQWEGRADAQSARAFGKRTGARLVLFGGLLSAGDSVRATASMLDAKTGRTLAEFEERDVPERLDRLSDSLTVAVLRTLGRLRHTDMARATSSPTASLGALKAYLQGEQFYRAGLWDSAQGRFEHAIELDSAFALAYHRLAAVRMWRDQRELPDSTTFELMRRTSLHTRGLAPRERLLATADSLTAEAEFAFRRAIRDVKSSVDEMALVSKLMTTLDDGLRLYPNDPELAFLLAEARRRYDREVGLGERDDRGLLALYDRAIGLDSAFAPAYLTPISLAAFLDGPESARRYTKAYLALAPPATGSRSRTIRLEDALLDPIHSTTLDVARLVDTLAPDDLCNAATLLRHFADSATLVVRFARGVMGGRGSGAGPPRPGCVVDQLTNGLQFRGHLREAYTVALKAHWLRPAVMYNLTRFGMVPTDTARAVFNHVLSLSPKIVLVRSYAWWSQDGDTAAIQTYLQNLALSLQIEPRDSLWIAMLHASVSMGRAALALARHDTAAAIRQYLTTTDTLHECWSQSRAALARLLIAVGRYREAAARLERRWPGTSQCSDGVDDVEWTLERARVFERLGRRHEAAVNYQFVADVWHTADPELQPYVREARSGVARMRRSG